MVTLSSEKPGAGGGALGRSCRASAACSSGEPSLLRISSNPPAVSPFQRSCHPGTLAASRTATLSKPARAYSRSAPSLSARTLRKSVRCFHARLSASHSRMSSAPTPRRRWSARTHRLKRHGCGVGAPSFPSETTSSPHSSQKATSSPSVSATNCAWRCQSHGVSRVSMSIARRPIVHAASSGERPGSAKASCSSRASGKISRRSASRTDHAEVVGGVSDTAGAASDMEAPPCRRGHDGV